MVSTVHNETVFPHRAICHFCLYVRLSHSGTESKRMHLFVKLKLFTLSYRVIILVLLSPNPHYTIPKETLSLNLHGVGKI